MKESVVFEKLHYYVMVALPAFVIGGLVGGWMWDSHLQTKNVLIPRPDCQVFLRTEPGNQLVVLSPVPGDPLFIMPPLEGHSWDLKATYVPGNLTLEKGSKKSILASRNAVKTAADATLKTASDATLKTAADAQRKTAGEVQRKMAGDPVLKTAAEPTLKTAGEANLKTATDLPLRMPRAQD